MARIHGIHTNPKPSCPECESTMRLIRPGPYNEWNPFWGCYSYPNCEGTRNIGEDGYPEEADDE